MNVRLKCSCGARFATGKELRGQIVRCPKCRKTLRVPQSSSATEQEPIEFQTEDEPEVVAPAVATAPAPVAEPPAAESSSRWQPHERPKPERVREGTGVLRWILLILLVIVPIGAVGVLVALPYFRTKDPREVVAEQYLDAVRRKDFAEAGRLSVLVSEHPRNITRVEHIANADADARPLRGSFAGLRQFHTEILQKYTYNESRGRFEPNDPLGVGLDALSNLEQLKKKAEEKTKTTDAPPKRYLNPEDKLLDDVIGTYSAIGELAKGAGGLLSSGSLGPKYEDLLNQTSVPLSDAERQLAALYARDPSKWKRLLDDRPFLDLPDLGEFELYDIEMVATIRTEGQSLGEPGRPIRLRLIRFTLGSIDTGWRVWKAE